MECHPQLKIVQKVALINRDEIESELYTTGISTSKAVWSGALPQLRPNFRFSNRALKSSSHGSMA
jgi:hypothetical protein